MTHKFFLVFGRDVKRWNQGSECFEDVIVLSHVGWQYAPANDKRQPYHTAFCSNFQNKKKKRLHVL